MTAQWMERIYIDGKLYYMASEPLEQYLSSAYDSTTKNNPQTLTSTDIRCFKKNVRE
jgi:hypothetical protein